MPWEENVALAMGDVRLDSTLIGSEVNEDVNEEFIDEALCTGEFDRRVSLTSGVLCLLLMLGLRVLAARRTLGGGLDGLSTLTRVSASVVQVSEMWVDGGARELTDASHLILDLLPSGSVQLLDQFVRVRMEVAGMLSCNLHGGFFKPVDIELGILEPSTGTQDSDTNVHAFC